MHITYGYIHLFQYCLIIAYAICFFEAVGVTEEERDAIGHPPQGTGLLGEFARSAETINAASVEQHGSATGFPEGHPFVEAFLGVPVMYASVAIGAFYVGRRSGGSPFSREAQARLEELAPYAAIAMANARTLETEHRRAVAAEAMAEAARGLQRLTSERQIGEVLADTLETIFDDAAELAVCWSAPAEDVRFHPLRWAGSRLCRDLSRMLADGVSQGQTDSEALAPDRNVTVHVADLEGGGKLAFAVAYEAPATMASAGRVLLSTLAEIGAIGLTVARRREAEDALGRYAVRDEIARDLHDDLIQSIYAIGLSLRGARTADPGSIHAAVSKASDDLNAVIHDLRSYIAQLSQPPEEVTAGGMLTTRINALLHDSGMTVPWTVTVQLGDQPLGRKLERQLYLIVREAVSNVERHASAGTASLTLQTRGDTMHLEISDDGRGFDRSRVPEGSVGLRSMEERVADLGGSIVITSRPGEGTSLIATLPIREMNDGQ